MALVGNPSAATSPTALTAALRFYFVKSQLGLTPLRRSKRNATTKRSGKSTCTDVLDNAYQQILSPFFQRLPAELRLVVYAFFFGSQTVQVLTPEGGGVFTPYGGFLKPALGSSPILVRLPCLADLNDMHCFNAMRCHSANYCFWNGMDTVRSCFCRRPTIGGLLRACRLLYAESISVLYARTSFVIETTQLFGGIYKSTPLNQQFTTSPLRFVQDIQIRITYHYPYNRKDMYAGLTMLAEQAVSLKKLKLAVKLTQNDWPKSRADSWRGENKYLVKKSLRIIGSLRGLEIFNLSFECFLSEKEVSVIEKILRELVSQPKGSRTMTTRQFNRHFRTRYRALMARKLTRG